MIWENVREVSAAIGLLTVSRHTDHPVEVPRDLPGVVILVHGVNDVGVCYQAVEEGLCQGLNERLNRPDLSPNRYRLPEPEEEVVPDPDKIYYRLQKDQKTNSPVIPFYWGYRASSDDVAKELVNGQVVDLHGNRLDRDFAKGGGMFTNATSNIPDMFKGAFNGNLLVRAMDKLGGGDAHPLLSGPERRYMVLAAKRLAALVEALRAVDPDETVTLIAHSQGCLVSLLAQAFLYESSARRADCLILNNPPMVCTSPFSSDSGRTAPSSRPPPRVWPPS